MMDYSNYKMTLVIPTYNRPASLQEFLEKLANKFERAGVKILIGDSSNNDKTYKLTRDFQKTNKNIEYIRYCETIRLSEKQIDLLKHVKTDYLCIAADSYIFSDYFIESLKDIWGNTLDICLLVNKEDNILNVKAKEYDDPIELFKDSALYATKFSVVIIKNNLISQEYLTNYMVLNYKNTLNFWGLYYQVLPPKIKGSLILGDFHYRSVWKNASWWANDENMFSVWFRDYYHIIESLPLYYDVHKEKVLKDRFNKQTKTTFIAFISLREKGIWDIELYREYKFYLEKMLGKKLKWFAYSVCFIPKKWLSLLRKIIKKFIDKKR